MRRSSSSKRRPTGRRRLIPGAARFRQDGLRLIVQSLPFAQGIYVPVALLSGLTPLSEAPRLLLIQLAWLAGLAAISRLVFTIAIRRVSIQGG